MTGTTDAMGLFHMAGICSYSSSIIHAAAYGGSGHHHDTLPFRIRHIQGAIHTQLAFSVFLGGALCRSDSMDCWNLANNSLLGFLLDLLHKVSCCICRQLRCTDMSYSGCYRVKSSISPFRIERKSQV